MIQSKRLEQVSGVCLFAALLFFSACAKPGQSGSNQTSPGASPAASPEKALVTSESGNWKVTVEKVVKLPKQPIPPPSTPIAPGVPSPPYRREVGDDLDQIEVRLVVEYRGPAGNVPGPKAAVLDKNGRRSEVLNVGAYPGAPLPKFKGGNGIDEEMKSWEDLFAWLSPGSARHAVKSRTVSTGEQFKFYYRFEDTKTENSQLVFADVPPIALPPAKDAEPEK